MKSVSSVGYLAGIRGLPSLPMTYPTLLVSVVVPVFSLCSWINKPKLIAYLTPSVITPLPLLDPIR